MASSDGTVILEGVPRMERRVKTGKAPKSAATTSGIQLDKIRAKEMRKPLAPVVNKGSGSRVALTKIAKKQTGRSVVEETGKEIAKKHTGRSVVETGKAIAKKKKGKSVVETRNAIAKKQKGRSVVEEIDKDAVAVDKKQTKRPAIDEMLDRMKFINFDDIPGSKMDEEVLKQVAEMQQDIKQVWRDWVDIARRAGIEFGGPSDLVPC